MPRVGLVGRSCVSSDRFPRFFELRASANNWEFFRISRSKNQAYREPGSLCDSPVQPPFTSPCASLRSFDEGTRCPGSRLQIGKVDRPRCWTLRTFRNQEAHCGKLPLVHAIRRDVRSWSVKRACHRVAAAQSRRSSRLGRATAFDVPTTSGCARTAVRLWSYS